MRSRWCARRATRQCACWCAYRDAAKNLLGVDLRITAEAAACEPMAQNLDERRSRVRLCRGQAIHVEIALIADNHPALGVKHDEPLRHVGEGGVE